MTTALATRNSTDLIFGTNADLHIFAKRIKMMCKGGEKLSENEALALAQVATVTRLNPFIGEVWYIPGKGPMIGIAGARRTDQENTAARGGYSTVEVIPCSPEEAGATEHDAKDVIAAFRAEITDSAATLEYQKMFTATLKELRESGVTDPVPVAREICGPRPKWVGYGLAKKTDQSTMSKVQLARKRAEADALKKKIVIPFGAEVADADVAPDYVDAVITDTQAETIPAGIDPEAIYNEARKRKFKAGTKETVIGDMTKEQLDWLIKNGKDQKNIDAALIVLQHDFGMTAEAEA